MLMTQTEINNLLKQINKAFESLEVRVEAVESKVAALGKPKSGNSTKVANKA